MKPKNDDFIEFDDVDIEKKANSVYDSPTFKNSLAISKGKPRQGFKIEDLPMLKFFEAPNELKCQSFKVKVCNPELIEENCQFELKGRTRAEILAQSSNRQRKSSTEILLGLQNKLRESKIKAADRHLKNANSKKMIIIEDN